MASQGSQRLTSEECTSHAESESSEHETDFVRNMTLKPPDLQWIKVIAQDLNLEHTIIFSRSQAYSIYKLLEQRVEYYPDNLNRITVFGKSHRIPRRQVAYGDVGMTYGFSGAVIPAKPWIPIIEQLRDLVSSVTGCPYNFVLINRYKDGLDHMGEHRDNEKGLVAETPIASLSLGQTRDFILRHKDARGKTATKDVDPVRVELKSGCLLLMNYPTNEYWYHALPIRKNAPSPRINLTFRHLKV